MDQVVTIGLDIAKSVFQVHGVDAEGVVVLRQRLTRSRMQVEGRSKPQKLPRGGDSRTIPFAVAAPARISNTTLGVSRFGHLSVDTIVRWR